MLFRSVFSLAFTNFIELPRPNYFILILGVYGSAINPLLFSHHTLPMGLLFAISLFPGSFEPICFLKAHLLISWTYDSLFLPLGLNGFCSLSFVNFSVLLGWASFLTFRFHKKKNSQQLPLKYCLKNRVTLLLIFKLFYPLMN